ncbi:MAG: hypothetical protein FWG55_05845 [Candidatus Bathyarchaeota archaeon]|nr:hypothetical protein [Candidatus Termiticorpusculum sp.]
MTALQLIKLLQDGLVAPDDTVLKVMEWYQPVNMIKELLQNNSVDFIVSVRHFSSNTSREYCGRPISDNVLFEVGVWTHESPDYQQPIRTHQRNELVKQIKQIFKQNPHIGTEKNTKNMDHIVGQVWVLCTTVMVAQLVES